MATGELKITRRFAVYFDWTVPAQLTEFPTAELQLEEELDFAFNCTFGDT